MRICSDYGNVVWGRNNRANYKNIKSQRNHVMRNICCKYRFTYTRELFRESKILNVFPLKIFNSLVFMHEIKSQTAPEIFQNKFRKATHKYLRNFSPFNYSILPFRLSNSRYRISVRGPAIYKNLPTNSEKMQEKLTVFKICMGKKLLELENEVSYF